MYPAVADREGRSSTSGAPPIDASARAGAGTAVTAPGEAEQIPIRPLSWRELADLPFAVLQARVRLVAGIAGIGVAVALGAVLGVTLLVSWASDDSKAGTVWAAVVSTLCCAWLLRLWITGMAVPVAAAVVHRQPITAGTAARRLGAVWAPLARHHLVSALIGIGITALGALLIITLIPSTIWLGRVRARRWTVAPILFLESQRYSVAVTRAKMLATGRLMPIAGLWIFLRGLLIALAGPVVGLLGYLSDISGTHRWAVIALLAGAALLVTAFSAAMDAATAVVVHIDRRCAREGADLRIPGGQAPR